MAQQAEVSPVWFLQKSTKAVKLQPETRLYAEVRESHGTHRAQIAADKPSASEKKPATKKSKAK